MSDLHLPDLLRLFFWPAPLPGLGRRIRSDYTRKTAEDIVYRGLGALRECLLAKGHAP